MRRPLNIFVVASEVDPYSKTGGLADVTRSLSKALFRLGHKVVVVTPFYEQTIEAKKFNLSPAIQPQVIELEQDMNVEVEFLKGELLPRLPVYFLKQDKYFGKRKELYGSSHENLRFALFDLASLYLLKWLNFKPDIIQCHDWHTGFVPFFLQKHHCFTSDPFYHSLATVFTIHNLAFQFGHNWWEVKNEDRDDGRSPVPSFRDPLFENVNFAKRGILYATLTNTVSERYAEEILTQELGQDLHRILSNRQDRVFGIINGIDYKDYNPATDAGITENFGIDAMGGKKDNKAYVQRKFGLQVNPDIPLITMVSRISEQKGFDLVMEIMEPLMRMDLQFLVVGGGEKKYEDFFRVWSKNHPKKCAAHLEFDAKQATQMYAASDMFLMPSRFEPCGLGQLISLRYGSIPIVHTTGGFADTISDFNPKTGRGNGFEFKTYDSRDLLVAITRALETYKHRDMWKSLVVQGMKKSFSWEIPARKYVALFRKAMKIAKRIE